MTGQERILTTLSGAIPDRVPITLFVQQEYLSWHFKRSDTDRVKDAALLARELGFDLMTRQSTHIEPHYARKSYPNWEVCKSQHLENGNLHKKLEITTPAGILSQIESSPYDPNTIGGIHFITTKYMLETPDDFEIFRKYMPAQDQAYLADMKEAATAAKSVICDMGISAPWGTGGVFNAATTLRSLTDILCDPYEDEAFYKEYMAFLSKMLLQDHAMLCETAHDCIGIQGNMANGGLVGPDFFSKYIQPYERPIIDLVKQSGKHALYHNCGMAEKLYGCYLEMQMSVFETLSSPPQGDNDLSQAKKVLGKAMTLSGNLDQIVFLKAATPKEVAAKTEELIAVGKPGGRYLFATSDYLEADTPLENVKSMIQAAQAAGRY